MACLVHILANEGGYVNHPKDPGGATNFGITHKTLAAWRGRPVTKDDVRNLTPDEATAIYRANYWNLLNADSLPDGVDLEAFDFGVNAGIGRSAKTLQKVLGLKQDGQIGPITIAAAQKADPVALIEAFSKARMDHYRSLRTWSTFKNGWTRRVNEIERASIAMAQNVERAPVTTGTGAGDGYRADTADWQAIIWRVANFFADLMDDGKINQSRSLT